jgi:hypothetical protein
MDPILMIRVVAIGLTVAGAAALLITLRDIRKRQPFPNLSHGRFRITSSSMKWIWSAALLVAFLGGGPEALSTSSIKALEPLAQAEASEDAAVDGVQSLAWRISAASYGRSVEHTWRNDNVGQRVEREAVRAPLWLVLALALYYLVVVRAPRDDHGGVVTEPGQRPHSA